MVLVCSLGAGRGVCATSHVPKIVHRLVVPPCGVTVDTASHEFLLPSQDAPHLAMCFALAPAHFAPPFRPGPPSQSSTVVRKASLATCDSSSRHLPSRIPDHHFLTPIPAEHVIPGLGLSDNTKHPQRHTSHCAQVRKDPPMLPVASCSVSCTPDCVFVSATPTSCQKLCVAMVLPCRCFLCAPPDTASCLVRFPSFRFDRERHKFCHIRASESLRSPPCPGHVEEQLRSLFSVFAEMCVLLGRFCLPVSSSSGCSRCHCARSMWVQFAETCTTSRLRVIDFLIDAAVHEVTSSVSWRTTHLTSAAPAPARHQSSALVSSLSCAAVQKKKAVFHRVCVSVFGKLQRKLPHLVLHNLS